MIDRDTAEQLVKQYTHAVLTYYRDRTNAEYVETLRDELVAFLIGQRQ